MIRACFSVLVLALVVVVAGCPAHRPCSRDDQCEAGQFCNVAAGVDGVGACQELVAEGEGEGAPAEGEGVGPGEGEGASPGEGEGASPGEGEGEGGGPPAIAAKLGGVGVGFGCVIDSNAHVQCWGANSDGQLGRADTVSQVGNPAEVVPGVTNATLLAVGQAHACARADFGGAPTVVCWGDNTEGNLGNVNGGFNAGDLVVPSVDANILGDTDLIAADGDNNGAITCVHGGGETWCFGERMPGYLPNHLPVRVSVLDSATSLTVSLHAICGTVGGSLLCTDVDSVFTSATGCSADQACNALGADQVSFGPDFVCADDGSVVRCAGDNSYGVVDPSSPGSPAPGFANVTQATRVAAMTASACALGSDHRVLCWGRAFEFNTGLPSTDSNLFDCNDGAGSLCQLPLPVPMPAGLSGLVDVAGRFSGACALDQAGKVACWGDLMTLNQEGEAAVEIPLAP